MLPLTLAALLLSPPSPALQEGPPTTPVRAVLAQQREVVQRERVIGSLRSRSRAVLAALLEGPLLEIPVREGAAVKEGSLLARVDTRRLAAERRAGEASLAEAEATLLQRGAELSDAREDLAQLEAAMLSDAVSKRELRRAQTAVAVWEAQRGAAIANVDAWEAQIALLDVRLSDADLRAPFDAVVVERYMEGGEWVRPGDALLAIVSADRYEAWLDVPERFIGSLGDLGATLEVELLATGETLTMQRPRRVPDVDPSARTFPLVAEITDGAQRLAPGMSVSAWLPLGAPQQYLIVPKDALVYRPGGVAVMTVPGDTSGESITGPALQMPVEILFELDREVAIAPGAVQPGSAVIVEGNERLFPMTPVMASLPTLVIEEPSLTFAFDLPLPATSAEVNEARYGNSIEQELQGIDGIRSMTLRHLEDGIQGTLGLAPGIEPARVRQVLEAWAAEDGKLPPGSAFAFEGQAGSDPVSEAENVTGQESANR